MGVPRYLPTRVTAIEMLRRAFRLRCPRCGAGALFSGWFAMHESCAVCGLRFEREQGYFVGAIYLNYAVTSVMCLGSAIALDVLVGLPLWGQLVVASSCAVLVPVAFFRYSRSLWLGIDHLVTTADEGAERRGRRTK
ncbi:MAG: DUF983 domain-containing protein [Candidatus Binatia bacterium]